MKNFLEPKLEVIAFEVADIITVSSGEDDPEQGENEGPIL